MVVLVVWIIALCCVVVVLAVLGYGLLGQVARVRKAVTAATDDLLPTAQALQRRLAAERRSAD